MHIRLAAGLLLACAGCLEFSAHDLPEERDLHRRGVERLAREARDGPVRFVVIGDTQRDFDEARAFVKAVNGRDDVHFVVQVGDFTNTALAFEWDTMHRIFSALAVPYFVVIGNHDQLANGRQIYERVYGPIDFAFTYRGVRLVLLDTNGRESGFAPDVPDLAWLAEQLAPGEHTHAVVLAHCPPTGGDFNAALRAPYVATLRDGGAIGIHGHAHRYEAWVEDGVRLFTADAVDGFSYLLVTALAGELLVEQVFY